MKDWRMLDEREEDKEKEIYMGAFFEMLCLCMTINTILLRQHLATHTDWTQYFSGGVKEKEQGPNTQI